MLCFSFKNFVRTHAEVSRTGNESDVTKIMLIGILLFLDNIKIMSNFPYSSDLAWNFWLLPTLKEKLRGRKSNTGSEVIPAVQGSLKHLPEKGHEKMGSKMGQLHII